MKNTFRILTFVLILMLTICGCGKNALPEDTIRYDLASSPGSLDPQYAVSDEAIAVVKNTFEGLTAISPTGEVVPACAKSWSVSADRLSYTFVLRENLRWADGEPLTAHDFAFALKRLFDPMAVSPAATDYLMIKNAERIINGELTPKSLGVYAKSDSELVITLERDDPSLPAMLSMAAASPCREDFFAEQKGRYGLDADSILCNGAFTVASKSDRLISLKRNSEYREPPSVENINMYINRGDGIALFMQQRSDVVLVPFQRYNDIKDVSCEQFYDKSWLLLFNSERGILQDRDIRAAIYSAADINSLLEELPEPLERCDGLIPPSAVIGGKNYRELTEIPQSAERADSPRELFYAALNRLGYDNAGKLTLSVSSFAPGGDIGGQLQRRWQDSLSIFVNMEQLDYEQLISRVSRGDFDIAIVPLVSQSSSPIDFLAGFEKTQSAGELISDARAQSDPKKAARLLFSAEQRIIDDFIAAPLFSAPTLFAMGEGISGAYYDPIIGTVSFARAVCVRE